VRADPCAGASGGDRGYAGAASGGTQDWGFDRRPGKLTAALGITRSLYGADVTHGLLTVRKLRHEPRVEIETTPRIGIRTAPTGRCDLRSPKNGVSQTRRPPRRDSGAAVMVRGSLSSEHQLQGELHDSRIGRGGDSAEAAGILGGRHRSEVGVIDGVEGLTSRFQLEALGDREEPAQGQVELELSGRPYDVPAQIAEGERGIGGESRRMRY